MRASALVALGASVLLLAGCAPAPELPAPLTEAQARQRVDEQNAAWWNGMFPDEPMPSVRVVRALEPGDSRTDLSDCLRDADIEGATVDANDSLGTVGADADANRLVDRAVFVCDLRFPYDLSEPWRLGMLSNDEQAWVWSYNQKRLVPCLQLLGYRVANRTTDFVPDDPDSGGWSPYFEMEPVPKNAGEWARIDARCPPSPIGPTLRPTPDEPNGG